MKTIKYNLYARVNRGTEDSPQWEDVLYPVMMGWNAENESIAKAEAHNGEYTIEEDGVTEPSAEPTPEERIAELEEALALLLSGVTE